MTARRYLIRIFTKGIDDWSSENPKPAELAKIFDLAESEQSVYEVDGGEDEWLVAAAHALANPNQSLDHVSILRIPPNDLGRFQIGIDPHEPGATGVIWVDYRHRNLYATSDQLIGLVRYSAEKCARGCDLVRRISKDHRKRSLGWICDYPAHDCPEHVKRIAAWITATSAAKHKIDRPQLCLSEIERELYTIQFPDNALRPRAAKRSSGDQHADWYAALNEQREQYAQYYLPAISKRFGFPTTKKASSP